MSSKKSSKKFRKIIIIGIISSLFLLILITCSLIYIKQSSLKAKITKANHNLAALVQSLESYHNTYGSYPESLTSPAFTDPIPDDPFADGPLKYLNLNDGAYVCVYSVGEDGKDNLAMHDIVEKIVIDNRYYNDGFFENLQIHLIDDSDNGPPYFMRALLEAKYDSTTDSITMSKAEVVNELGWQKTLSCDVECEKKMEELVGPAYTLKKMIYPILRI